MKLFDVVNDGGPQSLIQCLFLNIFTKLTAAPGTFSPVFATIAARLNDF